MRKAMQLGSADYILKPIEYEELEGILGKVAQRVQKRAAQAPPHRPMTLFFLFSRDPLTLGSRLKKKPVFFLPACRLYCIMIQSMS